MGINSERDGVLRYSQKKKRGEPPIDVGYAQTCDYIGQIREGDGQDSRVGINRFQNLGFLLSRGDCCCPSNTDGRPRFIYSSGRNERVCIRPGEEKEEKSFFFFFSLCDVISRTQKRRSEQEE